MIERRASYQPTTPFLGREDAGPVVLSAGCRVDARDFSQGGGCTSVEHDDQEQAVQQRHRASRGDGETHGGANSGPAVADIPS